MTADKWFFNTSNADDCLLLFVLFNFFLTDKDSPLSNMTDIFKSWSFILFGLKH